MCKFSAIPAEIPTGGVLVFVSEIENSILEFSLFSLFCVYPLICMVSLMFLVYSLTTSYVYALTYIFVIFTITALFYLPLIPTFMSFFPQQV